MIGLMVVGVIVGYIFLAKFIVTKVYEKKKSLKKKYIALAIVILIPTWDAILGLPIYLYLCKYHAGVKIYQTVDNVEGFYVGEESKKYRSPEPYKGYRYVDYKEKESGKYYRNSWLDNNTSERCIPVGEYLYSGYAKAFEQGKCIAKEEITENEVSLLIDIEKKVLHIPILYLDVYRVEFIITDRKTHKPYMQIVDYFVDESWTTGPLFNTMSGSPSTMNCNSRIINTSEGFYVNREDIINYLTKGDK